MMAAAQVVANVCMGILNLPASCRNRTAEHSAMVAWYDPELTWFGTNRHTAVRMGVMGLEDVRGVGTDRLPNDRGSERKMLLFGVAESCLNLTNPEPNSRWN